MFNKTVKVIYAGKESLILYKRFRKLEVEMKKMQEIIDYYVQSRQDFEDSMMFDDYDNIQSQTLEYERAWRLLEGISNDTAKR